MNYGCLPAVFSSSVQDARRAARYGKNGLHDTRISVSTGTVSTAHGRAMCESENISGGQASPSGRVTISVRSGRIELLDHLERILIGVGHERAPVASRRRVRGPRIRSSHRAFSKYGTRPRRLMTRAIHANGGTPIIARDAIGCGCVQTLRRSMVRPQAVANWRANGGEAMGRRVAAWHCGW